MMNPEPKHIKQSGLGPFYKMMLHHWAPLALGGMLALLAAIAAIGLLSLSGWFIAATAYAGLNVATAKAFNFFLPSIGVRLFAIARTAARYGERIVSHDATFRILEALRVWCYKRLEPLAPARLGQHHSGDLLTRIITDIDTLDNLYLRVLTPSVVAAVVMAMLVGFMGYFSSRIALLNAALLIGAGVVIPIIADKAARTAARQLNTQTGHLRTALVDGIHGLAVLLTCGAESRHLAKIHQRHNALVQSQQKMSRVTGMANALMGLVSGAAVVGTLYIGVGAVQNGALSGPNVALLILAVMAGFDAVVPLSNAYQYLGQTQKAAARLHQITRTPPAVTFPSNADPVPCEGHIEFEQVAFQYAPSEQTVLEQISFKIQSGQRIAVIGATGAGKSTLLYLLARFEDPLKGNIRLGRRSLNRFSEATLRSAICIVDQKAYVFNGTLRDNLLLANSDADDSAINDALSTVQLTNDVRQWPDGLDTWVGEAGQLLSGGQARRLAIARALLSDAPIWAFDEPTEGLDTETARAMMQTLLARAKGKTVIMVTHRPEAIEQMDQVILIEAGRIAAIDSPGNLVRQNTLFSRLLHG